MSEKNQIISAGNLQTVVVVCFVLSLLAIAFNFYNFARINQVMAGTQFVNQDSVETDLAIVNRLNRISNLEGRLASLETQLTALAAADEEVAEEPTP
ncbi:MAG: hypothetical protein HN348_22490 [Proteobacteria bacterium]|nr:hypothetical protein [Pseudomonadota bacterium]